MRTRASLIGVLVLLAVLAWPADRADACVGDCGDTGTVRINDLILGANIALGLQPPSACAAFRNSQGLVDIAQLIQAVNNALQGCPSATPTPSPYELTFMPASLNATIAGGSSATFTVVLSADREISEPFNFGLVDPAGVLLSGLSLTPASSSTYNVTIRTAPTLSLGVHRGTIEVRLCLDSPTVCASPLPGAPWTFSYELTIVLESPTPSPSSGPSLSPSASPTPSPTRPPAAVFNPASIDVTAYQDELPVITVAATIMNASPVFPQFAGPLGVFQPSPPTSTEGHQSTASFYFDEEIVAGIHEGNLELRLCKDLPCTAQYAGSPFLVPFRIEVLAGTNLTPLSPWPGIDEWAQHQANAAHTGYVPVTLDPEKFNRRWKWSAHGLVLQPVATSDGAVFIVNSGYFTAAQVRAISEVDKSPLWEHDFGTVFAANPPSTHDGDVFLATSGHEDTFMWSFAGSSGGLNFRSGFDAQWEHYYAPTIAGGSVYTNGGYYGGMVSFKIADGSRNWFAGLSQYDQWTPAVDASYAYAFMPDGLNAIDVTDGTRAFTIDDPDNAVQAYSVYGAPVIGADGRVIVVNGRGGGVNRLVSFDIPTRSIKWSVPGSFRYDLALADGVIYVVNGAQLEARDEATGSRLWGWLPDEPTTDPFQLDYATVPPNVIATDNLIFVSSATRVYAIDIATRQSVWSFPKPGHLALSPNGILYIVENGGEAGALHAINLK
jgi:outer membrane protein assembly factor BamB